LVKSSESYSWRGFEGSLVKVVSVNFFCFMKAVKKALLGMRFSGCNQVG
jgi:hypothetical protein